VEKEEENIFGRRFAQMDADEGPEKNQKTGRIAAISFVEAIVYLGEHEVRPYDSFSVPFAMKWHESGGRGGPPLQKEFVQLVWFSCFSLCLRVFVVKRILGDPPDRPYKDILVRDLLLGTARPPVQAGGRLFAPTLDVWFSPRAPRG
jgi:hypothetical protein